jgi:hypothetical protein
MKLTKQQQMVIDKLYDDRDFDVKESLVLKKLITNNDEFFNSLPFRACDVMVGLIKFQKQLSKEEWMERLEKAVAREDYEGAAIIRDLIESY